jgi:pimeloyl-ACP methyl ester carboxylesterase
VHLEEMDLPDGLRLNLSNRQAIRRYTLDEDEYQQKLSQLLSRIVETQAGSEIAPTGRQRAHPRFWASLSLALLLISGLVFLAAGDYVSLWWAYNTPAWLEGRVPQEIKYAETTDGVQIAYATSGAGTPLVLVVGWSTHLQLGALFDAPDIVNALSSRHLLVRYDGRGFGMSDRDVEDISLATRVRDLEAVVAAVGAEKVAILGASKGGEAAIPYTAAHPEKVSSLIIAGGTLGLAWTGLSPSKRGDYDNVLGLLRSSWDVQDVRALLVDASAQLSQQELTESLLISGSGPAHAEFLESSITADVSAEAGQIRQPTLLVAGLRDQVAPIEYARQIAAQIPQAKIEILDTSHTDTIRGRETIGLVLEFLREEGLED